MYVCMLPPLRPCGGGSVLPAMARANMAPESLSESERPCPVNHSNFKIKIKIQEQK